MSGRQLGLQSSVHVAKAAGGRHTRTVLLQDVALLLGVDQEGCAEALRRAQSTAERL